MASNLVLIKFREIVKLSYIDNTNYYKVMVFYLIFFLEG